MLLGPGQDGQFLAARQGVRLGELTTAQQQLALQAIRRYVSDLDPATAAPILARYTTELPQTYLAFVGSGTMSRENDYLRLDGPSLWLEYSGQASRDFPGTVHPHSCLARPHNRLRRPVSNRGMGLEKWLFPAMLR